MSERLRLHGVTKSFGGLSVASDVCLSLSEGDRTALIGPNGAGKTTLVNLISGALQPSVGDIHLDARESTNSTRRPERVLASCVLFR